MTLNQRNGMAKGKIKRKGEITMGQNLKKAAQTNGRVKKA
jgi:hypothetical protein